MKPQIRADQAFESWLDDGPTRMPEHLVDAIVSQLEHTHQRKHWWLPGREQMNRMMVSVGGVAAVALIAVVGGAFFVGGGGDIGLAPTPMRSFGVTPTVAATPRAASTPTPPAVKPSPLPSVAATPLGSLPTPVLPVVRGTLALDGIPVHDGPLTPGRYQTVGDGGGFGVQFTVPAGWSWDGRALRKGAAGLPDGAAIFFYGGQLQVYSDPCHWETEPPSAPTEDVVAALLAAQPGRIVTKPVYGAWPPGVSGAYNGGAIELTVPGDIDIAACDGGQYRSWGPDAKVRSHEGPGERDLVWFWNVYGANSLPGGLVIDRASFPGTPADVLSELDDILGSLYVGHWG